MNHYPGDPRLAAHRGGGGLAPENTLAAMEQTARSGNAGWIEFDLHRTRDGHLVVCHDSDVSRTTDGADYRLRSARIAELDLVEVRRLDAGRWFSPRFSGEQVPLFEEVLDLLASRCRLMIELKSPELYPGIAADVTAALRRRRATIPPEAVAVWSSNGRALHELHQCAPEYPKGLFVRRVDAAAVEPHRDILASIGVWPQVTARDVAEAHGLGLSIVAATTNSRDRFHAAQVIGTDVILTDFPEFVHGPRAGREPEARFDPAHRPVSFWSGPLVRDGDGAHSGTNAQNGSTLLTEIAIRADAPLAQGDVAGALPWTLRRLGGAQVHPLHIRHFATGVLLTVSLPLPRPGSGPTTLALHTEGGEVLDVIEFGDTLSPSDPGSLIHAAD